VEVALDVLLIEPPVPLTILQLPVPDVGELAAKVTVVRPHVAIPVWSVPALAVVGAALTVIVAVFAGLIKLVHAFELPDDSEDTEIVVDPELASAEVVKVPVPAVVTVIVAVALLSVLGAPREYVTIYVPSGSVPDVVEVSVTSAPLPGQTVALATDVIE